MNITVRWTSSAVCTVSIVNLILNLVSCSLATAGNAEDFAAVSRTFRLMDIAQSRKDIDGYMRFYAPGFLGKTVGGGIITREQVCHNEIIDFANLKSITGNSHILRFSSRANKATAIIQSHSMLDLGMDTKNHKPMSVTLDEVAYTVWRKQEGIWKLRYERQLSLKRVQRNI